MVVFFLLVLLLVQIGFFVASRSMAIASLEAATRRVASGSAVEAEQERVAEELDRAVPGAEVRSIVIGTSPLEVIVEAVIDWSPPGPDLVPVTLELRSSRARFVAP